MNLPEFSKYTDSFSVKSFTEKIGRIAKRAGSKLVYASLLLYYTLESKNISAKEKAVIIGALGYLISPLDLVPDAIPLAGLGDDLAVLLYVLQRVWSGIDDDVKAKARAKLAQWFDEDELEGAEHLFDDNPQDNPV